MRYLLGLLLVGMITSANAQQYLIKYDLHNYKSNYYKIEGDTDRVRSVNLKKNGRIILKVENFNPFYWNAKVTSYKTPVQEESGYGNAFNPFSVAIVLVLCSGSSSPASSPAPLPEPAPPGASAAASSAGPRRRPRGRPGAAP